MDNYIFLQHYWWFLISLLGALLVFLLFVQGGQSLLFSIGKTENEQKMLMNSTGRKWEFTFTTHFIYFSYLFLFIYHLMSLSYFNMSCFVHFEIIRVKNLESKE